MPYAILLALIMTVINLNEYGMLTFAVLVFTGWVCLQTHWSRCLLFGFYIVAGFWGVLAG